MKIKQFYRTQRDLACALNHVVDTYWDNGMEDEQLIQVIKEINENNPDKLLKDNNFTKVVQQQCGKRRLEVVGKILGL